MKTFSPKFLLLAAIFSLILVCILPVGNAYAVSLPSRKMKVVRENTVSSKQTAIMSRSESIENFNQDMNPVIQFAMQYLGAGYSYGAAGPDSFDCSGFTMYVMGNFGISLPHTARGQSGLGVEVLKEYLMPGDLVYFATSGGKNVSHVGIYIKDGCFIHASLRGVRISSLNEEYYMTRYVMANRVMTK